jgi:hypothetical protein
MLNSVSAFQLYSSLFQNKEKLVVSFTESQINIYLMSLVEPYLGFRFCWGFQSKQINAQPTFNSFSASAFDAPA